MKATRYRFDEITIPALEGWVDVTDPGEPLTLTKGEKGVGALQFSLAFYKSGAIPKATRELVKRLLVDFASNRGLGNALTERVVEGPTTIASAEFHHEDDFVKVWYVTDGINFALATYVCDWAKPDREIRDADEIVEGLRFDHTGQA